MTLSCLLDKLTKQVEWSALTIEPNTMDKRAEKSIVYTFEDGGGHVNRDGSGGENVIAGDEGLYTCRSIPPVLHTETTSLEVLIIPRSVYTLI